MLPFQNIDKINRYDKNTVHGYVRRAQKLFEYQIPLVIDFICLLFFYETDQFEKNVKRIYETDQFEMNVNEHGTIISIREVGINSFTSAYNGCSCFGTMNIMNGEYLSKFIYQWRFEYYIDPMLYKSNINMKDDVVIGITDLPNVDWYKSDHGHHIALSSYGCLYKTEYVNTKTGLDSQKNIVECYGVDNWIFPKDEIIINIDIKEKKMEYIIVRNEGGEDGYHFEDVPIKFLCKDHKYRMAIYCQGIGMTVKLVEFNKITRTS